jgi:F-type H+-transporting ATPase subunit b
MDQTLNDLGGLLLGSVPTILLFLLIVILYRLLVYGPLTRVLNERRERTEGAVEHANQAIAAAEAKAQEYEAKVRAARAEIFHAREARLSKWNRERERALADAQQAAQKKIAEAKKALEMESANARRALESSADELAREILKVVLPPDLVASGSSR